MSSRYPWWDVSEFLITDERACLYLKAAAEDDMGNGDTIRLAWKDIQDAHDAGRISINPAMTTEEISRVLNEGGICHGAIHKITTALLTCLAMAA